MNTPLMIVTALVLLAATAYAQSQIPRFTAGRGATLLTRAVLLAVGIALGYIAVLFAQTPLLAVLSFAIGLGIVHVPAAFILFVKRESGTGKS